MDRIALKIALFSVLWFVLLANQAVYACCGCRSGDCSSAANSINQKHRDITDRTNREFDDDLRAFEKWVIDEFFQKEILPAMRMMTTQMNAVAMQHTQIIGTFLDAKNQLETQRLFQELQAEAHRDYIPSDDFCWFGTNIKSMAATMTKARYNTFTLGQKFMARQLGSKTTRGSDSVITDLQARWDVFRRQYCDPSDNNRSPLYLARSGTGLELACDHDGPGGGSDLGADEKRMRTNHDIDYTRMIDLPRTLDVDFTDGNATSDDERDIVAISENLYGHRVLSRGLSATMLTSPAAQNIYYALRSVVAKRGVAEYTFNAIVALKSSGTVDQFIGAPLSVGHTRQYLAAIMRELYPYDKDLLNCPLALDGKKLCDWDIYNLIGEDPSYYSQLEIMGKKMYQNPDFYVKLYDTPANVARKGVAMKAIELMIDREMYESQLRREMAVSVLLSSKLRATERRVTENLTKAAAVVRN